MGFDKRENITNNLERLKRQYLINIERYDKPALLDLSAILRLWVDMKDDVQNFFPNQLFRSYTLTGKLKKMLWGNEYVLTVLPGGVSTKAGDGQVSAYSGSRDHSTLKFSMGTRFMYGDAGTTVSKFLMIYAIDNDHRTFES